MCIGSLLRPFKPSRLNEKLWLYSATRQMYRPQPEEPSLGLDPEVQGERTRMHEDISVTTALITGDAIH